MNAQTAWTDYATIYNQTRQHLTSLYRVDLEAPKRKRIELLITELAAGDDVLTYQAQLDAATAEAGPDDPYDISNDLAKLIAGIEAHAKTGDALDPIATGRALWTICQRLNRLDMPENESQEAQ